ncbi:MAG: SigB/SigF/SigG family RNA polymerase sigma factor [Armatimonadota bacterium]
MTVRELDTLTANRLWEEYARTRDPRTRDAIVHQFERLAYSIANRFARRGTENEDLFQVAMMGLVKAVDRFDPTTRNRFSTFATPTILGELRRYFRDHGWSVHVPRGMQELAQQVTRAAGEMTERLGRAPTAAEIAARLELPEERVEQALALEEVTRPLSLDGEFESGDDDRSRVLEQCLGAEDAGLSHAEDRLGVQQAVRHLSEPLRNVIDLRYLRAMSQRETARQLGLSQMQVSRMEHRALEQLRSEFAVN